MTFKIQGWIDAKKTIQPQEIEEDVPTIKIDIKSELNQKRIPKNKV